MSFCKNLRHFPAFIIRVPYVKVSSVLRPILRGKMNNLIDIEKKINSELTTKINKTSIKHNQIYVEIDKDDLIDVVLFIKTNKDTKFRQLIDITVVDYPEETQRFKIVYLFLSHEFNHRMILSYSINENELISSLTSVFPSANWMEREVFDMYGVNFKNHPDLTMKILHLLH